MTVRAKRLHLTRPEPTEGAILAAVLARLQYDPRIAWAARMNTGAHAVGVGKARRYIRYGFPGCSDILGQLKNGRIVAIEIKTRTGRLTEAQDAFLDRVRGYGGLSGVVRSVEDVEVLMDSGATCDDCADAIRGSNATKERPA